MSISEDKQFENAMDLADETFTNLMNDAWERSDKDGDIDPPMVAMHTLSSSAYTLVRLGWTKKELIDELSGPCDAAEKHNKEDEAKEGATS